MLDLLWRTRFRWKLWPRQVTGDRKYGTEDNLVAIENQGIRAYIPIPDMDHRTEFFSADRFRYEAERDVYFCPAGKELRFDRPHSRCAFPPLSRPRQRVQSLPAEGPMYHKQTGAQPLPQRG